MINTTNTAWKVRPGHVDPDLITFNTDGGKTGGYLHPSGGLSVDLLSTTDLTARATDHGHFATVNLNVRRPDLHSVQVSTYFDSADQARQALINLATSALKAAEAL